MHVLYYIYRQPMHACLHPRMHESLLAVAYSNQSFYRQIAGYWSILGNWANQEWPGLRGYNIHHEINLYISTCNDNA